LLHPKASTHRFRDVADHRLSSETPCAIVGECAFVFPLRGSYSQVASGEINPSMTRTQLRIETPRPVPSTLTSDEIRAHICPANAALLPKRSRKLARINSSADEIAAALLADGSRKQFKTELNLTIEFLTVLHAALDQSEREQARQVVVPLRPSAPPGIAG
jgi:hypothetical protein